MANLVKKGMLKAWIRMISIINLRLYNGWSGILEKLTDSNYTAKKFKTSETVLVPVSNLSLTDILN